MSAAPHAGGGATPANQLHVLATEDDPAGSTAAPEEVQAMVASSRALLDPRGMAGQTRVYDAAGVWLGGVVGSDPYALVGRRGHYFSRRYEVLPADGARWIEGGIVLRVTLAEVLGRTG